jgi:hypothetical protein
MGGADPSSSILEGQVVAYVDNKPITGRVLL